MRAGYLLDTDWIIDFDLLIAATCLRHQLKICPNNRRRFEAVEDLSIVSI